MKTRAEDARTVVFSAFGEVREESTQLSESNGQDTQSSLCQK